MSSSRPPVVATSLEDAVRIALPYLRIAHAGLEARLSDDCMAGVFTAITILERALRAEADTKRTEIPAR